MDNNQDQYLSKDMCEFIRRLPDEKLKLLLSSLALSRDLVEHAAYCHECGSRFENLTNSMFEDLPEDEKQVYLEMGASFIRGLRGQSSEVAVNNVIQTQPYNLLAEKLAHIMSSFMPMFMNTARQSLQQGAFGGGPIENVIAEELLDEEHKLSIRVQTDLSFLRVEIEAIDLVSSLPKLDIILVSEAGDEIMRQTDEFGTAVFENLSNWLFISKVKVKLAEGMA